MTHWNTSRQVYANESAAVVILTLATVYLPAASLNIPNAATVRPINPTSIKILLTYNYTEASPYKMVHLAISQNNLYRIAQSSIFRYE